MSLTMRQMSGAGDMQTREDIRQAIRRLLGVEPEYFSADGSRRHHRGKFRRQELEEIHKRLKEYERYKSE